MKIIIFFIVLACFLAFALIFGILLYTVLKIRKQASQELSVASDIYSGPTGDPYWEKKCHKAPNYKEPCYVYENREESTEYLRENGRIVGYRISSDLVIHSRVHEWLNPPSLMQYVNRYGGLLLEEKDIPTFVRNIEAISELRQKAKDTPLEIKDFWFNCNGIPAVYEIKTGLIYNNIGFPQSYHPLVLKRQTV